MESQLPSPTELGRSAAHPGVAVAFQACLVPVVDGFDRLCSPLAIVPWHFFGVGFDFAALVATITRFEPRMKASCAAIRSS